MTAATLLSDAPAAVPSNDPANPGTAPGSAVSAVVTAQTAANQAQWVDTIQDADVKSYAIAKGWKDPGEVVNGYLNMEKLLGGEKLPMPKGPDDKEGWERVYKATGRPETPDGYKLPVPQGQSPDFAKAASAKFHELGISARQGEALASWFNGVSGAQTFAEREKAETRFTEEIEQVRKEWGQMYDINREMAMRAAKQCGFTVEEREKIVNNFGAKRALTLFAKIGERLGEDRVDGVPQGMLTSTGAQARLDQLMKDREWVAKHNSGDADTMKEKQTLVAAINGMSLEEFERSLPPGPQQGRAPYRPAPGPGR